MRYLCTIACTQVGALYISGKNLADGWVVTPLWWSDNSTFLRSWQFNWQLRFELFTSPCANLPFCSKLSNATLIFTQPTPQMEPKCNKLAWSTIFTQRQHRITLLLISYEHQGMWGTSKAASSRRRWLISRKRTRRLRGFLELCTRRETLQGSSMTDFTMRVVSTPRYTAVIVIVLWLYSVHCTVTVLYCTLIINVMNV